MPYQTARAQSLSNHGQLCYSGPYLLAKSIPKPGQCAAEMIATAWPQPGLGLLGPSPSPGHKMSADLYPLTLEPIVADQIWARAGEDAPEDAALPGSFFGTLLMAGGNPRGNAGPTSGRSLAPLRHILGP